MDYIKEGEVWKNTGLLPDFPMYAAGVFRRGELKLIIFLWHANLDQRTLYYVNLFRILRDLVEMSLLRAYDYNLAIYEKQFIKNTRIMREDAFNDCLENYQSLADRNSPFLEVHIIPSQRQNFTFS